MYTNSAYCRDIVARHDYDRYVLSMAVPAALRPALWALFAFQYEIAKTAEVAREVQAGHIRLTWWQEAINNFANGQPMPKHEVAEALGAVIKHHGLELSALKALIDARRLALDCTAPDTLDSMACFAEATNAPLLKLVSQLVGSGAETATAQSLGTAYGLCGLVRAIPFMAVQKRCTIPTSMLYDIGLMPEQIDHLGPSQKLNDAVRMIINLAQSVQSDVQPQSAFFKKQKSLTDFYLKRITKAGYNPFDIRVCGQVPFLGFRI